MLYQLGPLSMQVAPFNVDSVDRKTEASFAVKPVLNREQPLEYVGPGQTQIRLSGSLFPHVIGGLDELSALYSMLESGEPQYLLRGDGRPFGWFAIMSVSDNSEHLDRSGVGRKIRVTIDLTRAPTPPRAAIFTLFAGLLLNV